MYLNPLLRLYSLTFRLDLTDFDFSLVRQRKVPILNQSLRRTNPECIKKRGQRVLMQKYVPAKEQYKPETPKFYRRSYVLRSRIKYLHLQRERKKKLIEGKINEDIFRSVTKSTKTDGSLTSTRVRTSPTTQVSLSFVTEYGQSQWGHRPLPAPYL